MMISGWFLCGLQIAAAQVYPDSSLLNTRLNTYQYREAEYGFFSQQALLLQHTGLNRWGTASLEYKNVQGDLRARQEADNISIARFNTEGMRRVKKYMVQGYFRFTRMWEDSVAYSHNNHPGDPSPYYLLAIKSGHWDRTMYDMGANISRGLLKEKLLIGIGTDYNLGNHVRNSDPRPEVTAHHLSFNGGIGYRISKHHTAGASLGYGYGTELISVSYSNRAYSAGGSAYYEYTNFASLGFGNVQNRHSNLRRLQEKQDLRFGTVYYNGQWDGFRGTVLFRWKDNDRRYALPADVASNETDDKPIGAFYLKEKTVDVFLEKKMVRDLLQLNVNFTSADGHDFNTELAGNNYIYTNSRINFSLGQVHHKETVVQYELFLKGGYERTYKADGTTSHRWNNSYATAGLDFNYYLKPNARNEVFSFRIYPSCQVGLNNSFTVPADQANFFTEAVLLPDADYYQRNAVAGLAGIAWQTNIKKQLLKLGVDGRYEKGLGEMKYGATDVTRGYRLNWQLKAALYF